MPLRLKFVKVPTTSDAMKLLSRILIMTCLSVALTIQVDRSDSKSRFNQHQTWNTKQFPVWKDGDPRYKNSWTGGQLKFEVGNDAPTLTGAKITFTIDIVFPHNQKVLPDGQVVWAKNCTINGTQFHVGEPVYPEENSVDEWNAVFPDVPLFSRQGDKQPPYVFVWKTWGKYWQVCDGPSSSLTIGTDDVPLGSYMMDVVIYHYRQKDKFIPIGYASTQFSITNQIPFAVSLMQVNDKDEGDRKFIQNRAVAFSITLHDPSQYLSQSDVTFNWNFGDGSGTVISRELTVTHTYTAAGAFKPQVVIQAAIPDSSCATPPNLPTEARPTTNTLTSESPIHPSEHITADLATSQSSAPIQKSTPASTMKTIPPTPTNGVQTGSSLEKVFDLRSASEMSEALNTATKTTLEATASDMEVMMEEDYTESQAYVSIIKRQAPNTNDCMIYRYGSFSTDIEIIEAIESVQIVQVTVADDFLLTQMEQIAVDFTVSCQGRSGKTYSWNYKIQPDGEFTTLPLSSLPTEVCTEISDADCHVPVTTICNAVSPSSDCQLILRHFFNDSGIFCVNVSMINDVSLAATNARVNINIGSRLTYAGAAALLLGIMTVVSAMGAVVFAYKRLKGYQRLTEDTATCQSKDTSVSSMPVPFWSLMYQQGVDQKKGVV
ncbi:melanocyte protein PMEL-like isoform X2 [Cyprinus carpio]|uniref:Melanocyte protein PMEL-like isoform X2 n=1 Tax=Cyprinus carpio TaxID=7962 RepID=A0A9Q9VQR2_CYPCA|nr:melanocyte protein PMEL-like isoform X2 [Cyprinus carpio]